MIANISQFEKALPREAVIDQMLERRLFLAEAERTPLTQQEFAKASGVHRTTLWRRRENASRGIVVDRRLSNSGRKSTLDPRVLGWSLAYMASFPKAKIAQVFEEVAPIARQENWDEPNYWKLRRAIKKLPADMRMLLAEGSREMFEKTSLTVRRFSGFPYELVQMDSTELDLWVLDVGTGELFKPWMTTIIDTFSRVVLAVVLHRTTPSARDVLLVLKQAILPKDDPNRPFYSLFKECQADNHPIFKALDVKEAMLRLGINYTHIPKESPNANGKQERFFRRFKEQLLANLIGFAGQCGALEAARQAAIPWPLLEKRVEKFLLKYHTAEHRGIHTTPWEKLHDNLDIAHGLIFNARHVLDALKVRHTATVALARDGIQLDGKHYSSPHLAGMRGKTIEIRLDPAGNNRTVEAYLNGEFIDHLRAFEDDPALGDEIAKARLERAHELKKFRKQMAKLLRTLPPIVSDAVQIASSNGNGGTALPVAQSASEDLCNAPIFKKEEE